MLGHGYSVNLYMFHGGTTFGFMNGANIDGGKYHAQTTSYDYDAALDESGRPSPKVFAFREVIAKYTHAAIPSLPSIDSTGSLTTFPLAPLASLWDHLGAAVPVDQPRNMETLGQSYGYILYRTTVRGPSRSALEVKDGRDYAQVYLNGSPVATLDRRLGQDSVTVTMPDGTVPLDIPVANGRRANFQKVLRTERKGITRRVTLGGKELLGWDVYLLPMHEQPGGRSRAPATPATPGPAFYRAEFTTDRPADTFLDTRGWDRGAVWVNGHALGRFWDIGPQLTMCLPGAWQHRGKNEIVVFDFMAPDHLTIAGVPKPIWK
jgi:beta-galactosidase